MTDDTDTDGQRPTDRHGELARELPDLEGVIEKPWREVREAVQVPYLVRLVERTESLAAAARASGISRKGLHAMLVRFSLYEWARAQWRW